MMVEKLVQRKDEKKADMRGNHLAALMVVMKASLREQ